MFGKAKSEILAGNLPPAGKAARASQQGRFARWLEHGPLPQRLLRGQFALAVVGLFVVTLSALIYQLASQYSDTRETAVTFSKLAAEAARPALGSPAALTTQLAPLLTQKEIRGIAIYAPNGRALAKAGVAAAALPGQHLPETRPGAGFGVRHLRAVSEITDPRGRQGFAVVDFDLGPFWQQVRLNALVAGVVFCSGLLVASKLSRRMSDPITAPYDELCAVADAIPQDGPADLPYPPSGQAVATRLIDTFNGLHRKLKNQETDLRQIREELEDAGHTRVKILHAHSETKQESVSAATESDTRYRNLFENNPMPMFVMDLETLKFVAVNYAALKHYGYTNDQFLQLSLPMLTHGKEPIEVIRAFRREAKSFDAGEWQHCRRQGEVIDMQLTAHAIVFDGKVAKIVLANDVTERNRAQRQLQDMHQQLVAASRRAGMAEVATDVLHNVGNVLNSVNVSATMLVTGVRASKVSVMQKVAELFNANRTDLGAFLGPEGKGQKMPDYLTKLAGELEKERAGYLSELELLARNIEHIKQVVAFQQNHAKVASLRAIQSARALVEEALRLTAGDFALEGIETRIECPAQGCDLHTDHHKVLQILINLMTNACQAMMSIPIAERRLEVHIAPAGGALVAITIRDHGCGINPESLNSIFNHGFTTKKSGHGFGLHGAANTAKELGGALHAASEGPGRGATFTLELPAAPAAARTNASQAA